MAVASWLLSHGAANDLVEYSKEFGDSFEEFWARCPRGDFLLAIAYKSGDLAGVERGAQSLRPLIAEYLDGTDELLKLPEELAARIQRADDPVEHAALSALYCTTQGAEDALMVTGYLMQAAASSAGDCAMMASINYVQRRSAELVRRQIPSWPGR